MTPKLLAGDNGRFVFFPDEAGTVLSQSPNATVYIGANADTKEKVVLKKISTLQFGNDSQRFKFFVTVATELKFDGLVKIIDIIFEDGSIYLVSEFVSGRTLKELICDSQYLDYRNDIFFLRIISNCLETLSELHKLKLAHCNIRPENIIVEWDDCEEFDFVHPKAKILSTENIKLGFKNMPLIRKHNDDLYKSPEQLLGYEDLVGDYSDIYSMGLILYEAIARESVFPSDKPLVKRQQVFGKIAPHYRTNEEVYKVIEKATVKPMPYIPGSISEDAQKLIVLKSLNDRYQSAGSLKQDIDNLISGI
ncbi:MAG: protein kinase [Bacteroidales bacterium]|nr:protein kinase [Bacteroidales bacterium]